MSTTLNRGRDIERPDRPESLIKLILTIFLIPAPFELINAFAKKESYDFRRLGLVIVSLALLSVVVAVWQRRRVYVQSAIGVYLVAAGAVVAGIGVVVTFRPDILAQSTEWPPAAWTTISALGPTLGLLVAAAGCYLVREQARRAREDLDGPSPHNVSSPKPFRLGDYNASLWRSPTFADSPGAEGLVVVCQAQLSASDLHYVAFYTSAGTCLFYVDLLDDAGLRQYDVRDTPRRRRDYEAAGRHMRALANRLDRRLRSLDSGQLVRMVLDVEKGGLFFYSLRDDGYLVGVTLDQTEVDPTDRKLSTLANELLVLRGRRPDDDFYRK